MKHTTAAVRTTLASIDATLRLAETPLWQDPEFLAWEAGQVDAGPEESHYQLSESPGDRITVTEHTPGPEHWLSSASARQAWLELDDTVRTSPMVWVAEDHWSHCSCVEDDMPVWARPMRMSAADYPAVVTHGPLLLGPEPGPVRLPADVVPA